MESKGMKEDFAKNYPIVKIRCVNSQNLEMGKVHFPNEIDNLILPRSEIVGHLVGETEDAYIIAKEVFEFGGFKSVYMIPKQLDPVVTRLKVDNRNDHVGFKICNHHDNGNNS